VSFYVCFSMLHFTNSVDDVSVLTLILNVIVFFSLVGRWAILKACLSLKLSGSSSSKPNERIFVTFMSV